MKKIVMVVCLALCGTIAFAQTRHTAAIKQSGKQQVASFNEAIPAAKPTVGYNASIFSKAEGDVLFSCEFSYEEQQDGVFTSRTVQVDDRLDGKDVTNEEAHTQQGKYGRWERFDSATNGYLVRKSLGNTYPLISNWYNGGMAQSLANAMDSNNCSSNNGWMFMEVFDQTTIGGSAFNAYIAFKQFNLQGNPTADVQLYQWYMKFYDQCFVDYSFDNGDSWTSFEINVTNVDVIVNGSINGTYTYTLPYQAIRKANNDNDGNIRLRLRWYSNVKSTFAGYGYAWMVDDFKVIAGGESRINVQPQYYTEGVYQLMPKGMELPLFWHARVANAGSVDQTGVTASIYNYAEGGTASIVSQNRVGNLERGTNIDAYVDPAGLRADDTTYGWFCMSQNIKRATAGYDNKVNTKQVGDYYVYANVTARPEGGDEVSKTFDTIYYRVNDADENGNFVWGHDNGVITAGRAYIYGYVVSNGNNYITDASADYKSAGYSVSVRYTLGDKVPVDADGNPLVIRGVEYVPSTDTGIRNGNATIIPTLTVDSCIPGSPNSVLFNNVRTGASNVNITDETYKKNGEDLSELFTNDFLLTQSKGNGFLTRDDYKDGAIFVEFPEQPELKAGMSYRVGYQLAEAGKFAVAASAPSYYYTWLHEGRTDSIHYYAFNDTVREGTSKYASRTAKAGMLDNPYDVRIYDNVVDESLWASHYNGFYPMIHLIIGPKVKKDKVAIEVECNYEVGEENGTAYNDANVDVCNSTDSVTKGATSGYSFRAGVECRVDSIAIDGEPVWSAHHGGINEESDYAEDMVARGDSIVAIDFVNVTERHAIEVWYAEGRTRTGINDFASQVSMSLQPNPATSQVRLAVEGVSGMLDCCLIDMSGRIVYNNKINAETPQTISLSGLAKGAYFVRITNSNFSKVEKLIVR
ncbi:MAG: T9SS type A sorting domain-containing protein [Bacteroidales bacterium]|nr:T9SS type A sorting domain-containing protein [Bacteroidales bacterium]